MSCVIWIMVMNKQIVRNLDDFVSICPNIAFSFSLVLKLQTGQHYLAFQVQRI